MIFREQSGSFLFFLLIVLFIPFHNDAEEPVPDSRIANPGSDTVFYCRGPVAVAPAIAIENIGFDSSTDGMKISIVNYRRGEDRLAYEGDRFAARWDQASGNLELTGQGTSEEYEEAVRQVFYENLSGNPDAEPRSFSISLMDADYLPHTEHFYLYIKQRGIYWTDARDSAANMNYYGLKGYLATITSSIENDFIWSKIDGVGWIGATDSLAEGTWKWATGPEEGTVFWQGNYNGGPVNNEYSFWNEGEPNNVPKSWGVDEDFAHINSNPNTIPKSWNDLPDAGDKNNPDGYYYPEGFVVEFGGMEGDPEVQLSASAVVAWSEKPEMVLQDFDTLVCGDMEQQLNLHFTEEVSLLMRPLTPGANVVNETSLSPVAQADAFGTYSYVVEITNKHGCTWNDTLPMHFRHQPEARFQMDEAECEGYNLKLWHEGETKGDAMFYWYSNDTVFASGMNLDSMEIPLGYGSFDRSTGLVIDENGCLDSLRIPVTVEPVLDFWPEVKEGCPPLEVAFDYSATETVESFDWTFGDGSGSEDKKPVHTFENSGTEDETYDVALTIISAEGCRNSGTLEEAVTVHPIPTMGFDFSSETCHSGDAAVNYQGSASEADTFFWDLSGFSPEEIIRDPGLTSGPFEFRLPGRPEAEIGLHVVSQFGCITDTIVRKYKRKPLFEIAPDPLVGCPPLEVEMELTTPDTVDQVDYFWELGEGGTGEGKEVSMVYENPDSRYDVILMAHSRQTGCSDTLILSEKIRVSPVPVASFSANPPSALISNPVIAFENQSQGADRFQWDFGDSSALSAQENPVHRFEEMGTYQVAMTAMNNAGCADSASMQVSVAFDKLFPPSAFSPNAAKEEDREFRVYAEGVVDEGYRLLVFNRWGEVVFESRSQNDGWNGKMKNGRFAPAGVYTWSINYYDFLGKKHQQQGTVTLLF